MEWADTATANEDRPPAWFPSDEEAAESSLALARSLGLQVNLN